MVRDDEVSFPRRGVGCLIFGLGGKGSKRGDPGWGCRTEHRELWALPPLPIQQIRLHSFWSSVSFGQLFLHISAGSDQRCGCRKVLGESEGTSRPDEGAPRGGVGERKTGNRAHGRCSVSMASNWRHQKSARVPLQERVATGPLMHDDRKGR